MSTGVSGQIQCQCSHQSMESWRVWWRQALTDFQNLPNIKSQQRFKFERFFPTWHWSTPKWRNIVWYLPNTHHMAKLGYSTSTKGFSYTPQQQKTVLWQLINTNAEETQLYWKRKLEITSPNATHQVPGNLSQEHSQLFSGRGCPPIGGMYSAGPLRFGWYSQTGWHQHFSESLTSLTPNSLLP